MMYGQMTAGSWIYIGSQGIVQGTYETFGAVARRHFGGTLAGRLVRHRGTRRHGRRAAARGDDARRGVPRRRRRRVAHRQAARHAATATAKTAILDEALALARRSARDEATALSVGARRQRGGRAPGARAARRARPTCSPTRRARTTCCNGYVPAGMTLARGGRRCGVAIQASTSRASTASIVAHVRAMLELQRRGRGDVRLRQQHSHRRVRRRRAGRVRHSRFRPRVHPSAVLRGKGTVPLGRALRRSDGHRAHRRAGARALSERRASPPLDHAGAGARALPGTAGAHLLAGAGRARAIRRRAERPRRDAASCRRRSSSAATTSTPAASRRRFARPKRCATARDAIADWPILNALLNVASGASWVSFHHGGGVGIGNSLHAGQVIVADGTPEMRVRLERVLTNDPGIGVARHADAGYEDARVATTAPTQERACVKSADRDSVRELRCMMLSSRFKPYHVPLFLAQVRVAHRAAACRCSCTSRSRCAATRAAASATTGRRRPRRETQELDSYADAARFFNPMLVTFTGGEPLLRRDLEDARRGRRRARCGSSTSR